VLNQLTEEAKDLLASCYGPERFFRPFDKEMHGRIFDLLDNSDNPLKAIAAPRGTGKTSIINLLLPAKSILFQEYNYIVPVSCTSDLAMQQSENLKSELMANEMIVSLYGELASDNFSKKQWVIDIDGNVTCVMPRGAGQQIRGLLYRNSRPNLILVDDLEDPEKMDSEEQRAKKKEWFYADLLNCVDRGVGGDWQVIMLGTILHQDSLLVDVLENKDWDTVTLELCDDDLNSYCPNFMPTSKVKELYEEYESAGKVDTFFREYKNDPVPRGEHATFPQSVFRHYEPEEIDLNHHRNVENVVVVDPAKTANIRSADTAIVGWGINLKENAVYVRDIDHGKMHFDEIIDRTISMVQRVNANVLGIEVTSLHEFITHPIKNELIRRGVHVEVIELHARGGDNERGKVKRIRSLAPYYRQGQIFHNPHSCKVLERQLMSFPVSKYWDVMDAFGYMPEILEIGERFMQPYDGEDETAETVELEYRELELEGYDMPLYDFNIV
jgi:hypothetical protein